MIKTHDNSVYIVNLYTVSTDSPVMMFILLIYSLALCWGNVSSSNVTTKFAQLQYFYHKILRGTNDIMSPPVQKLEAICPHVSPINSVPDSDHNFAFL